MKQMSSQTMLEYILIFAMVAMISAGILMHFDLKSLKNYVFMRPADSTDASKIKIEAMTE